MMHEIWRVIPFFTAYEVSDQGRVRRRSTGYIRAAYVSTKGYLHVGLTLRERRENHLLHRLVLRTFVGEPPTPEHQGRTGTE